MERRGVLIDSDALFLQSNEIANRLSELEEQAYVLAGQPFNLASTKQLQEILFDKLGLPVIQKTPKGAPSTNEEVLEELAFSHELPKVLVEHRGLSKLKSTYTDKLPQMVNPQTGRVHTSYHQAVTFQFVMKKAVVFVRHLLRAKALLLWQPTIRKSSYALWRTYHRIRA